MSADLQGGAPDLAPLGASIEAVEGPLAWYRLLLARVRSSAFVRDSIALLVLNVLSRGASFFASAYALRCLGPYNIGFSALVQASVQQVGLAYNGGFDTVAVRRIAADHDRLKRIARAVVAFRGLFALCAAVIWSAIVIAMPSITYPHAWLLGAPLLLINAGNIAFVFNAVERLPIQTAIGTGGTVLAAVAYLVFFHPSMPLGADLVVLVSTGLITTAFSWGAYHRTFGHWPVGAFLLQDLWSLLRESWRYWSLAVATFVYSTFQIPLIAHYLGAEQTGLYRSAFAMAAAVELLYNSVNALLLPRLVAWRAEGIEVLWRRQRKLFVIFVAVGASATLLLVVAAPVAYRILLGPQFAPAIPIFQLLLLGRLIVFVGQIYAFGLAALNLDNAFLAATVLGAIASLVLNVIVLPRAGLTGATVVSIVSELFVSCFCFLALRRHVRSIRRVGRI